MSLWTDLTGISYEVKTIDVNGVPTRALRAGAGEPIIFLHGISGHLEAFVRTVPGHVRAGMEVHLIDMLGHGYTGKPDIPYTVDRLAEHVLGYMDACGLQSANVTGLSLGGWVTGWLLVNHPERVRRATMVLAAGNPAMGTPEVAEFLGRTTTAAVMSDDREQTRSRLQQVIHDNDLVTEELVDVRFAIYHQPEFRARLSNILTLVQADMYQKFMLQPEELNNVKNEVLLAWSEEDAYSDVTGASYYTDNLPNHKLMVFKDAGHWPPYERPDTFAEINTKFICNGLGAIEAGVV
jgi:2-hydroxy-6-oxonona-2,4-dienedioate hydrolase